MEHTFNGISETDMELLELWIHGCPSSELYLTPGMLSATYRINSLIERGYLKKESDDSEPVLLRPAVIAFEEYRRYKAREAEHLRIEHFRFWIPNILSGAAIAVSIIALILQLRMLP